MKKLVVTMSLLVVAAVAFSTVYAVATRDAINKECPYKKKPVDSGITSEYKGPKDKAAVTVAFCCPGCKKTFDAKPDAEIKKFKEYKAGAQ
ncbi:MAG TPA: hypothetical protein VE981_08230 [Planctomycetota bacterium]|nr:hypothetical protein [Planctomycetota bacterium]